MVILKHKKVKMQVVKFTFFVITILIQSKVFSQPKQLNGSFTWHGPAGLSSLTMNFDDNYFMSKTSGDFGGALISKGYYLIKKDTLVLMHEKYTDPKPSYYEVLQKSDSTSTLFGKKQKIKEDLIIIDFKIYNTDDQPIQQGCHYALLNRDKIISMQLTDSTGQGHIFTEGRVADKLTIGFIGYKTLIIDLNDLWGYSESLQIVLSKTDIRYNQNEYIEKFILYEGKDNILRLKSLNSNLSLFQNK